MDSGKSAYMKEDLLKRKFVATWHELCELVGISPEIEITSEELTAGYTKTPYPEVNRRVTRLLRCNEFPDHYDIVELIERCNTKHKLGIGVEEKTQMSREIFKDVGKILKAQRARDFKSHFGSHLTDDALKNSEDPAASDAALMDRLRQSLKEGHEKLEQLCEGYVIKQELESEVDKSGEGDVSESDDEEEEEEGEGEKEGEGAEEGSVEEELEAVEEGAADNGVFDKLALSDESGDHDDSESDEEKASSKSSGDESGDKPTPFQTDHTHTPSPSLADASSTSNTSALAKRLYSDSDEDSTPSSKKRKLPPPIKNSEQDISSSMHVPPPATSQPETTIILVNDEDSDSEVIVLSD